MEEGVVVVKQFIVDRKPKVVLELEGEEFLALANILLVAEGKASDCLATEEFALIEKVARFLDDNRVKMDWY